MIHVDTQGTGTPTILLHSSGASGQQWRRLAGSLMERKCRVALPDLSGHGASPAWSPSKHFDFHVDVDAVTALLDAQTEPTHLVGHSYGGFIALQAALVRPAKVRSLTVYDPVSLGVLDRVRDNDVVTELEQMRSRWAEASQEEFLTAFVDFWGGQGAFRNVREDVRTEMRRTGWVVREGVRTLAHDETPASAYATLSFPALLMSGEASPTAARRVIERLSEVIKRAHIAVIPGAAHFGPLTHADAVNASILEHIARN